MLDMGAGDLRILLALRRSGPEYCQTPVQLKKNLFVTAGAITKQIARLERRGLVERSPHGKSRRSIIIRLTKAGLRLVDAVMERHRVMPRFEAALYSLPPEELEAGRRFIRRLMGKVEATRRRASSPA
ncbi:MAG: MarR family transcriptional regulator, partial [Caulobacteraceae bacterium]|nr:MarR family transcriptional regulator [Caulobacteraceae bacterium]